MKTAMAILKGAAINTLPTVTYIDPTIKGSAPYVLLARLHSFPNRKFQSPFSIKARKPLLKIKYTIPTRIRREISAVPSNMNLMDCSIVFFCTFYPFNHKAQG
jgi:hypothetical protein